MQCVTITNIVSLATVAAILVRAALYVVCSEFRLKRVINIISWDFRNILFLIHRIMISDNVATNKGLTVLLIDLITYSLSCFLVTLKVCILSERDVKNFRNRIAFENNNECQGNLRDMQ